MPPTRIPVIKTLICPSDGNSPKIKTIDTNNGGLTQGLHVNYVGCAGDGNSPTAGYGFGPAGSATNLDGLLYVQSTTKIATVTDGTSNTMMFGEILVVPDTNINDLRGRYNNSWTGNNLFTALYQPNTTVADVQALPGDLHRLRADHHFGHLQ